MKRDSVDKAADVVKGTVDDVRDTAHEIGHRSTAEAEKTRRETDDGTMTASDKVRSMADEAKNRIQADIDAAKRKARHE